MALISTLLGIGAALAPTAAQAELPSVARWGAEHVLGSSLDVMIKGAGPKVAERAGRAALAEITRLDQVLSRWRPDSELSRLNRRAGLIASPDLYAVVELAEAWRRKTRGAFSSRLGGLALASDLDRTAQVRAAEGATVQLDRQSRWIGRPPPVAFDLDGVAKGYVLDGALLAARWAAPEATGLLIDLGGDIRVWSAPGDGDPWRLGVADPANAFENAPALQILDLSQGALAYSGRRARDGGASHILDPRRGGAPSEVLGAVAIGPTGACADALATSLAVMSPVEGLSLLGRLPEASGLLVVAGGQVLTSANWAGRTVSAAASAAAPAWPPGFALTATVEIPAHGGVNYERPYVAAWITDADKRVVKTLLILGPDARWRESNYVYWRRVERMDMAAVARVARTTRAPGRYDVIWDGRDDAGKPVPRGAYTLNVEASREHGGHSLVTLPLNLGAAPASVQAAAALELGVIRARYGPRPQASSDRRPVGIPRQGVID